MFKKLNELKPYLLVAFIPLLFTIIFGAMFSPIYIRNIPVAVLDMDKSQTSKDVIQSLKLSETLEIRETYGSMEEIKAAILESKLAGAVVIPSGFGAGIRAKKGSEATVLMDNANFMLGNTLTGAINTIFETINGGIQIKYLEAGAKVPFEARQEVYTLSLADRTLYNPQLSYMYYMYPGFLAIFVQQTYLAALVPLLIEAKRNASTQTPKLSTTKSGEWINPIARAAGVMLGLSLISTMVCIKVAGAISGMPMRGDIVDILILQTVFLFAMTGMSILIASFFEDVAHGVQFTMFLTIPTFLCSGYAWPYYLVEDKLVLLFKAIWPLYYFVNPLKDVMLKAYPPEPHYIVQMLVFGCFWLTVSALLFKRRMELIRMQAVG